MAAFGIIIGLALLLFGRKLFWLFVGGVGFMAGLQFAEGFFHGHPQWWALAVALLAGVIGAVLALVLQKLAIGVAGFLTGATALFDLANGFGRQDMAWIAAIVGGVIGAVLILLLFDWALIVLSAVAGAILIVNLIELDPHIAWMVWVGLFLFGLMAQAAQMRRRPVPEANADRPV